MATVKYKIKASTLIEVITAMVVIMTSFSSALMIMSNVIRSNRTDLRIKASIVADNIISEALKTSNYDNYQELVENLSITKNSQSYNNDDKIRILSVSISDPAGFKLVEKRIFVLISTK